MLRNLLTTLIALAVAATAAAAQTTTTTQTTTTPTSPNQGAYDTLSPGNKKIVDALFNAQPQPTTTQSSTPPSTTTTTTPTLLLKDDIAAMHLNGMGWGVIFKQMKANGQIPPSVKNLGQLVSGRYQPQSATTGGTTITTASGKSQVVGSPATSAKSGKGHLDDASAGAQGPGGASSGSDQSFGMGQSGATASGANGGGRALGHLK